jgi:hypothetical protein
MYWLQEKLLKKTSYKSSVLSNLSVIFVPLKANKMNENTRNYILGAVALLTVVNTVMIFTMDNGGGRQIDTPTTQTALVQPTSPQPAAKSFSPQDGAAAQQSQPVQAAVPQGPPTAIAFPQLEHDFGTIKQETKNKHIFKFTNSGTEPLIIQDAKGSCGCTVPKYPREPIAPGAMGEIEVEYSPGKQKGSQSKTVTLTANTTPAQTVLNIKANVEEL